MTKIPTSKVRRSAVVAGTLLKVGGKTLSHKAKSAISASPNQDAYEEDVAKLLFKTLSTLRGTGLKVAQMLCMEQSYIPETIRKELGKACYQAPGINRALVRKVIKTELGDWPENIFASFESTPFAAASLGQVHFATDRSGKKLAVKIQYPGIAETIRSDMATLRQLAKVMPSYFDLSDMLPEIETRLLEEVDYRQEREKGLQFARHAFNNIVVAKPIDAFCSDKVLTTEYLEGEHLDSWLANQPDQTRRNQVCQTLNDLFTHALVFGEDFHADPNVGNFLVLDDGRLAVLDFGCVQPNSQRESEPFLNMLLSYREQDTEGVIKWFSELYEFTLQENSQQAFAGFMQWKSALLSRAGFDFSTDPAYLEKGIEMAFTEHKSQKLPFKPKGNIAFMERVMYGYLRLFQQAQVQVHYKLTAEEFNGDQ
ncbi:ABC1 kinase family protein [Thaumasiovibrio subtropicus]|uniref:ABC1 kinase family protein n=1 Tax=Thaumasiovibrio subtropicus TaxID=1891207 RepID=UPI000B34CD30|nr:AarF/ABC1/UbiB kinase family protein [Thaumasiovibrio subtropicus]